MKNINEYFISFRILYLLDDISELIGEIQLEKLPSENETVSIIIPCGYFTRGGIYVLQIEYKYKNSAVSIVSNYQVQKNSLFFIGIF